MGQWLLKTFCSSTMETGNGLFGLLAKNSHFALSHIHDQYFFPPVLEGIHKYIMVNMILINIVILKGVKLHRQGIIKAFFSNRPLRSICGFAPDATGHLLDCKQVCQTLLKSSQISRISSSPASARNKRDVPCPTSSALGLTVPSTKLHISSSQAQVL